MTSVYWPNGSRTKPKVSSKYGPRNMPGAYSSFHYGTDFIGFNYGKSVLDGVVTLAGPYTAKAGISVAVDSTDPISGKKVTIVYMHASKVLVKRGQRVKAGQSLLIVGETGNATGPCDHTEIRYWSGGSYTTVDPEKRIVEWIADDVAVVRQVGKVPVNRRQKATTASPSLGTLPAGAKGTFDKYTHGQNVGGNDIWFHGAKAGGWFWSGGFTSHSTTGMTKV